MARVSNVQASNKKKVDVTVYCPEMKETEDEVIYVTIKKLKFSTKRKMNFLAIDTLSAKTGKEIVKKLRSKKKSLKDMDGILKDKDKALDFFLDMDLREGESNLLGNVSISMERMILEDGVDFYEHSFKDDNGKVIKLDYDFFENLGKEGMVLHIIKSIKEFSSGLMLGK